MSDGDSDNDGLGKLLGEFQDIALHDKVEEFIKAGLPSRAEMKMVLSQDDVKQVLKYVQRKKGNKLRDFRKLRELIVQSNYPDCLVANVYEASAKYSLEKEEWSEFLLAANGLLSGPYNRDGNLGQNWVYFATLAVYEFLDAWESLQTSFYSMMYSTTWSNEVVKLVFSIRFGNVPRIRKILAKLPISLPITPIIVREGIKKTELMFKSVVRPAVPADLLARLDCRI